VNSRYPSAKFSVINHGLKVDTVKWTD
jgi:hypothetical protein